MLALGVPEILAEAAVVDVTFQQSDEIDVASFGLQLGESIRIHVGDDIDKALIEALPQSLQGLLLWPKIRGLRRLEQDVHETEFAGLAGANDEKPLAVR